MIHINQSTSRLRFDRMAITSLACLLSVNCGCQTIANRNSESGKSITKSSIQPESNNTLVGFLKSKMKDSSASSRSSATSTKESKSSASLRDRQTEQVQAARKIEQQGDLQEAINAYEALVQEGNRSSLVQHRLAVLYDQTGQTEISFPLYQQALESDPQNVDLLADFGFHFFVIGENAQAESLYRQALQLAPNDARANNHLAILLAQSDYQDDAMKHFKNAGLDAEQAGHNLQVVRLASQEINEANGTLK
jgi:tetratricopeptide (TPR) repeat protein